MPIRWSTDPDEKADIVRTLEQARQWGLVRVLLDLEAVLRAADALDPRARHQMLEAWVEEPGALYVVAMAPPTKYLKAGGWYGATIRWDNQDARVFLVIVDEPWEALSSPPTG